MACVQFLLNVRETMGGFLFLHSLLKPKRDKAGHISFDDDSLRAGKCRGVYWLKKQVSVMRMPLNLLTKRFLFAKKGTAVYLLEVVGHLSFSIKS